MTGPLLKDLRNLRVLVYHPEDQEGDELVRHLQRIGCQVERQWPPPCNTIPSWVDVVLLAITPNVPSKIRRLWQRSEGESAPSLIVLVDYENPTMLQTVLELNAHAVVGKPIRPFGLLTNLVVARQAKMHGDRLNERIQKLERRVRSMRTVNQAKAVLMDHNDITEKEAYELIRKQAMAKRVSTEEIAKSILIAEELLHSANKFD